MNLKYKTFEQLMASVTGDLERYTENNMIDTASLIKHAKFVNADLGLKLNTPKEITIQIENYKADLPKDFVSAVMMVGYNVTGYRKMGGLSIPGTHLKDYSREELVEKAIEPNHGCLKSDGSCNYILKTYGEREIRITEMYPIQPTKSSLSRFCSNSVNRKWLSEYTVDFKNEEIHTNFKEGEVYMSYLSELVDEEGNLLVLDHELTNEYYEYYLKTKIFEKLYFDYNEDVERKYIQMRDVLLPKAKGFARNIVTTPEYKKFKAYTNKVIEDYYNQYVKMFV